MKKKLSLVMAFAMTLSLAAPAMAAEEPPVLVPKGEDEVRILYTNDVHTFIDNTIKNADGEEVEGLRYSQVAGYKKATNADFLVDAGDHIQGSVYGSYDQGETIIKLMEATGYTCSTLGNHEFDYNMARTRELVEMADYDYVSCNIYNEETGEQLLPSYKVYTAENGKKVAFVGFTTPETITSSTPLYFMNEEGKIVWSFSDKEEGAELYRTAQAAIDAAAAEADYVIGVGHMGIEEGLIPFTSEDVIHNTRGLTAFIDGHSHTKMTYQEVMDKDGKPIVLTQTECYLHYLGDMTIDKDGKVTTRLVTPEELMAMDVEHVPEVKAIEDTFIATVDEALNTPIAFVAVDTLKIKDEHGRIVRNQDTVIGNLCSDAIYNFFDSRGYEIDIAFMNGGGIRADLEGNVSGKTLQKVYPYGNILCLVDLTGQQILDGLEYGVKNRQVAAYDENGAVGESGGFLHPSGLTYHVDPTIPNTTVSDASGMWLAGPTGEYRVHDVMVKNRTTGVYEPLDLNKHYAVGGINYTLRQLGDGFAMFTGDNIVDAVAVDYMALMEFFASLPVDPATGLPTLNPGMGYDAPQGRIIIDAHKSEEAVAPVEVPAPVVEPAPVEIPVVITPVEEPVSVVEPAPAAGTYTVKPGDSLWKIAQAVYGTGYQWSKIYEANKSVVKDPNVIYVGMVLQLP